MSGRNPLRNLVDGATGLPDALPTVPDPLDAISRAWSLLDVAPTPDALVKHLHEDLQHAAAQTVRLRRLNDAAHLTLPFLRPDGALVELGVTPISERPDLVLVTDAGAFERALVDGTRFNDPPLAPVRELLQRSGFRRLGQDGHAILIAPIPVEGFGFRTLEIGQALAESLTILHTLRNEPLVSP